MGRFVFQYFHCRDVVEFDYSQTNALLNLKHFLHCKIGVVTFFRIGPYDLRLVEPLLF